MSFLLENIWTIIFVIIILVLFVYGLLILFKPTTSKDDIGYKKLLLKYRKSFGKEIPNKTLSSASDYFYIEALYEAYGINIMHIRAIGNALVGLGILGTFWGLSMALGNGDFSFKDPEKALDTVTGLYGGMKTAFWTSALGMGLSLVYGWLVRWKTKTDELNLSAISEELDTEYLETQTSLIAKQNSILANLGSNIGQSVSQQMVGQFHEAMDTLIQGVMGSMKEYMTAASKDLQNSAESLNTSASNIKSASEQIDSMVKAIPSVVNRMYDVTNSVQNLTKELNTTTIAFSKKCCDLVATIGDIENAADELTKVLDNTQMLINDLDIKGIITSQEEQYTKVAGLVSKQTSQIDSLTVQYKNVLASVHELQSCIRKLHEAVSGVANIENSVEAIFTKINKGLHDHVTLLHNESSDLITKYTDKFTHAAQSINSIVGNLNATMNSAANTMVTAVTESAKIIEDAGKKVSNKE